MFSSALSQHQLEANELVSGLNHTIEYPFGQNRCTYFACDFSVNFFYWSSGNSFLSEEMRPRAYMCDNFKVLRARPKVISKCSFP
jgi:hypothetical protein